jgi:hypothetical protein
MTDMTDQLIRLGDVPKLDWLPTRRGNSRLSMATVWRWCLRGVTARDGARIKLRAVRVGETLCTSEAWLREYFDELTAHDPDLADQPRSSTRTTKQRRHAAERAEQELTRLGI